MRAAANSPFLTGWAVLSVRRPLAYHVWLGGFPGAIRSCQVAHMIDERFHGSALAQIRNACSRQFEFSDCRR